jgi:hypothetical protein
MRGAEGERAKDLLLRRSGCPVFCFLLAPGHKKTGKQTAQTSKKKTEGDGDGVARFISYIALALAVSTSFHCFI